MVNEAKHTFGLVFPSNVFVFFFQQNVMKKLPQVLTVKVWKVWRQENKIKLLRPESHEQYQKLDVRLFKDGAS